MPSESNRVGQFLRRLQTLGSIEELIARLRPRIDPPPAKVRGAASVSQAALERRWELIGGRPLEIADLASVANGAAYSHNIEHFIGTVKVPIGLAGPLRVNGLFAQGDFYVPLATTEAALVASYSRGAALVTEAGAVLRFC
jgi:hydroxymethylglutaryl-CoA reductase (NADPH)